ncbi:MAG: hypothetical protein AAFY56_08165 [Pseudomonadota bacterium]
MRTLILLFTLIFFGVSPLRAQEQISLPSIFGTYVGYADVIDEEGQSAEQRETDTILEAYDNNGVRIRWINVTMKDGRRDWDGVTRRVSEVGFVPSDYGDFLVRGAAYDPFKAKQDFRPYHGSPVQWALLDTEGLHVYSFVIEDDGQFELQRYSRDPDDGGLRLEFERFDDGDVKRRIEGHAVRAIAISGN